MNRPGSNSSVFRLLNVLAFLVLLFPATMLVGWKTPASAKPGMEESILQFVNLHRHKIGLPPLSMNGTESAVAIQHSRDMATGRAPFGHTGFHERIDLLRKRLGPIHLAAENVAYGQMSAREVVDGWLNSPGHRRNIEGNFRLTGIGLARDRNGRIYYTQIFTR